MDIPVSVPSALLEQQKGVLTRGQALSLGWTDSYIDRRVRQGRWQRLYPGVYAAFSGVPSRDCLLWAAVLRAGDGAALSHWTAAEMWGLATRPSDAVHVTIPVGRCIRPVAGLRLHYSLRVAAATHPVALPPRTRVEETVLDLAQLAATADEALSWALRACGSRLTTPVKLTAAMQLRTRLRWRGELAKALDPQNAGVHSLLEHRYVTWVERPHGLPAGRRQQLVQRGRRRQYSDVDYGEYLTIVELDGRAAHSATSRVIDSQRDNANAADGKITLRYSWWEVSQRSCEVAAEVASVLRNHGWAGRLRRCGSGCRLQPTQQGLAQQGLAQQGLAQQSRVQRER
jgi:Transcriptional regulator, AbiEi antitoxin